MRVKFVDINLQPLSMLKMILTIFNWSEKFYLIRSIYTLRHIKYVLDLRLQISTFPILEVSHYFDDFIIYTLSSLEGAGGQ